MRNKWDPERRRFMKATAVAVAATTISCSRSGRPWRFLTSAEGAAAVAVCDALIPPDQYAGAVAAGAVVFIDRQLTGHYRNYAKLYRDGLAALDRASQEGYHTALAGLRADCLTELLKKVEKGEARASGWSKSQQQKFFSTILAHTMQSYYGDPRHGGNRDEVGYRMLGIPATPVRGRSKHDLTLSEASQSSAEKRP